jgi:hypothetical protein
MVVCDAYARPTRSYFNIYKDEDGEHAVQGLCALG